MSNLATTCTTADCSLCSLGLPHGPLGAEDLGLPAPVDHKVGDLVVPNPSAYPANIHGVVFKIVKLPVGARGVNYVCERADGTGRGLRGPAWALLPHDPAAVPASTVPGRVVTAIPILPIPDVGAVVLVKGVRKIDPKTPYVVTAESRKPNCVRLTRLGGEDGRYWPSVPVENVTVISLADLAALLG